MVSFFILINVGTASIVTLMMYESGFKVKNLVEQTVFITMLWLPIMLVAGIGFVPSIIITAWVTLSVYGVGKVFRVRSDKIGQSASRL